MAASFISDLGNIDLHEIQAAHNFLHFLINK